MAARGAWCPTTFSPGNSIAGLQSRRGLCRTAGGLRQGAQAQPANPSGDYKAVRCHQGARGHARALGCRVDPRVLGRHPRLSKDNELLPDTTKASIHVTMIPLLVRPMARMAAY
jgi:hypothetical protein